MAYLTMLKTQVMKSLRATFDNDFPETDFANIICDMEYPVDQSSYPSIWVDFDPTGPLSSSGIGAEEFIEDPIVVGQKALFYRWRFGGAISFTVVALSSMERDRLLDALITVMAFSRASPQVNRFRSGIEGGEFIAMNIDFDQIDQRGFATNPGTPWGTDDLVYEGTIAMEVIGEFTTSQSGTVMSLTSIELVEFDQNYETDPLPGPGWNNIF